MRMYYGIYRRDEHQQFVKVGRQYLSYEFIGNKLRVVNENTGAEASMPVSECSDFIFKLTGRRIYAKDGAEGLKKFMDENAAPDDLQWCRVLQICKYVNKTLEE